MTLKPVRRTRALFGSVRFVLVLALVAQLVLAAGMLSAAPAAADGGSFTPGGYTFGFDDFSSLDGLKLNGVAATLDQPVVVDGHASLRVLRSVTNEHSSVFWDTPIQISDAAGASSFSQKFQFRINADGADGIVFMVSPSPDIVGGIGGGIGYAGIDHSVGVEFDTWWNPDNSDPYEAHVGIDLNGDLRSVVTGIPSHSFENGKVWTGWVDYDGAAHRLEVRASDDGSRPDAALVAATVDIPAVVGGDLGYFGVSAASGAATQTIDVLSWNGTGTFPTVEPVVAAGDDQTVTEGSTVQLTGTTSGPVDSVKWTQVSGTGPHVSLLGGTTLTPSFRAVDDGTYVFRLTGTAGTGADAQSVSDDVQVTVTNVAPVVGVEAAPTVDDGTVMVSASVTDPGILDTHTATVDFGDGTTSKVAAAPQGAGWAVVNAAHVYQAAGTYTVGVTVADDDGGTATTSTSVKVGGAGVPVTQTPIPCALCALGAGNGQGSATIDMNGQANWTIKGGVYDNGTFKIQSPSKLTVTPSGSISVVKGSISCTNFQDKSCPPTHTANAAPLVDPLAGLVLPDASGLATAKQWPCTSNTCTVQPGVYKGPFNINSGSVTTLKPGTYVFTKDLLGLGGTFRIDPTAAADQGVTLYFTQGSSLEIRDQGALKLRAPSTGALAGVAIAYSRANSNTLAWRGSRNSLTGTVYAPAAQLRFDNDTAWTSSSRFIAGTVSSQNSTLTIDPSAGANAGSSQGTGTQPPVAASPIVVPDLKVTTDAPKSVAPGGDAKVTTTVTNHSTHLAVPVLIAVTNKGSSAATIDTVAATAQTQGSAGTWSPLATGAGESITLTGLGAPIGATTYPATGSGNGITGTRIPAGGSGVWAGTAQIELSAASLNNLLDTGKVTDLRISLSAAASGASTILVQRLPANLLTSIRASAGKVTAPSVTLAAAQANKSISFADLAMGDSHDEQFTLTAAPAPKRSDYASDGTYQSALTLLDASKLIGLASAQGTAQVGTVYAAAAPSITGVDVPILTLTADPVPATRPGHDGHWKLTLANTGSATATGIHLAVDGDGATATVTGLPTSLAAGASASVDVALSVPADRTTTMHPAATLTWADSDTAGNTYGPIGADGTQKVVLPANLAVTLQGTVDGAVVHYELSVVNSGDDPVTGIAAGIPVDNGAEDGAQIVAGSLTSSQGQTTNTGADIGVQLGDLAAHATALVNYAVDYSQLTAGQTSVTTQAQVTATNVATVWSDDPMVAGEADPTVITFTTPPGGTGTTTGGTTSVGTAQIAGLTPSDGTSITQPSPVSVGAITAPAGGTIANWKLSTYPTGTDPNRGRTVATGTGDPSGTSLGTFDPTLLSNGGYQLRLTVTDNTGAISYTETALVVDGKMKLGRYTTTLTDMTLGVAGISIQVQRSYDSFDNTTGDFGVGWNLAMADFKVTTNGPLGQSGWTENGCGTGMIFLPICFTTSRPHYVTVTWPDGHNEVFNLTPAQGSTFMPSLTSAQFTGRPGTTSTLTAVDDALFFDNGNLEGGSFGADGIYNPTKFVLTDKTGNKYDLTVGVGLTKITARTGETITVTGKAITSSAGPAITISRDTKNRVTKITGPDGHTVSYDYTSDGNLATVTNQLGNTTTYHYTGHYLDKVIGPDAATLARFEYDDTGRIVAVTIGGNRTVIASDPGSRQQTVTDATGRLATVDTYNESGDLTSHDQIADGHTYTTGYTYDDNHQQLTQTDPGGGTITVARDPDHGWITSRTDQAGRTSHITYNSYGQPTSFTRNDGTQLESWTYDKHGNLTTDTPAAGPVMAYTYDGTNLATVARNGEVISTYAYDSAGRPTKVTDATGHVVTASYDAAGHLLTQTGGSSGAIAVTYDATGNPLTLTNAAGNTRAWAWTPLGDMASATDELGHATSYAYDTIGNLVSVTNRDHQTYTYTYDADNRPVQVDLPGRVLHYSYDGLGRATTEAVTDGTGTITTGLAYTPTSLLAGTTTTGAGLPTMAFTHTYDPTGALTKTTGPGGTQTYSYDNNGDLATVKDLTGGTFNYSYDLAGRLTKLTRPNGLTETLDWNNDGNLASQIQTLNSQQASTTTYNYDTLDRLTSKTDTAGTFTYTYDANSNLTKANNPTGYAVPDETFSYDALGNRTSDRNNPSGSITYDAANRRVHDATYTYTYNREGDLTAKTNTATGAKTSYTWTPDHLLTSVTTTGTSNDGTTNYRYDALGRRIQATTPDGTVTTWAYDGTTIHGVYQGSGNNTNAAIQATYSTDLTGTLLSTKAQASGNPTYPLTDNTGSVTSQTNTTGQTVATTQYGAFGDPHATSGTDTGAGNAYTFTGHAYDTGTDLVYARARYYDPTVGAFLSEDPLGSINNYTYALNQPTNLVDPTGAEVAMEYGEIANTETDAGVAASTLPSDTILVRGGLNTAEHFVGGSGVTADFGGILEGVSVNSGSSVEEAASGLLNNQVHVSTVGDVLDAGGTVVRAPTTANPGHCLIGGCSADTFVDIFSQVPNPAK